MSIELPIVNLEPGSSRRPKVVALVGNPNAGKTTLFNRLTGIRAKTSNFAGTTIERHSGHLDVGPHAVELIDLPGLYALSSANAEEVIAQDILQRKNSQKDRADLAVIVIDSTNLARNLFLASEVQETGIPLVVLLNMADLAKLEGLILDTTALAKELGVPVVPVSARTGSGVPEFLKILEQELEKLTPQQQSTELPTITPCGLCRGRSHQQRYDWAEKLAGGVTNSGRQLSLEWTEKIDRYLTHPILGIFFFAFVMSGLFVTLFSLAEYPMGWIEGFVEWLADWMKYLTPAGLFQSLLVDGVIAGVGGIIVFLPQICLLFFLLSLLEDTGYLSRAAFVMDRLMKKVGLPGKAFVPMLSAHACAIPAIMATRVIEDRRDRLVTILTLPLLTCSARLPVYTLITAMLFAKQPVYGGLAIFLAYSLGITAALEVAFILKCFFLVGESKPILIELPSYKRPSLRNAVLSSLERGWVFMRDAGTTILVISVVLWLLLTFPRYEPTQLNSMMTAADQQLAQQLETENDATQLESLQKRYALEFSIGGRLGKLIEPIFSPLGFDWRIDIGVLSSFAAREVVVSTLSIIFGLGEEGGENEGTLASTLVSAQRTDGSTLFNLPTSMAFFVFYILAMQCFPTQVITARETGHWNYAYFQFIYMTVLAYTGAWLAYQITSYLVS